MTIVAGILIGHKGRVSSLIKAGCPMRCLIRPAAVALQGVLLSTFLMAFTATAQELALDVNGESPGQSLFQREWKWSGPDRAMHADNETEDATDSLRAESPELKSLRALVRSNKVERIYGDGLGPLHNANSCAECHVSGGGSGVEHNVLLLTIDPRSEVLTQWEAGAAILRELFPGVLSPVGTLSFNTLVHDRSTREGYAPIRSGLGKGVPEGLDETWFVPEKRQIASIAKQPVVAGRYGPVDYYLSQRNSPALFGIGVIESISLYRLRIVAKRQAARTNGAIRGRVAGRFGWRGQVDDMRQFVAGACGSELGLNQSLARQADDPADPKYVNLRNDITSAEMGALTHYVKSIPRPVERPADGHSLTEALSGETVFNAIGCEICHLADVRPVSGIFSDLLLHDMGPHLQAPFPAPVGELPEVKLISTVAFKVKSPGTLSGRSGYYGSLAQTAPPQAYPLVRPDRPQFPRGDVPDRVVAKGNTWDALQREWKTPPLWGVADTAPYLHDGRAETLEEAILWHGGEATSSRDAYQQLPRDDRDLVLAFLSTLRAPEIASPAKKLD